jgi:flagellar basal-body rod protein FlgC
MDLMKSLLISASGMKAQSARMRVIAENLANADSIAQSPDGQPYRRKMVTFRNELDRSSGVKLVESSGVTADATPFGRKYDPGNPAADVSGYVQTPNVEPVIEISDMQEAQRSYEANLNVIDAARSMLMRTIDLLRS